MARTVVCEGAKAPYTIARSTPEDTLLAKLRTPKATARDFALYLSDNRGEVVSQGLYITTQSGKPNPAFVLGELLSRHFPKEELITLSDKELEERLKIAMVDKGWEEYTDPTATFSIIGPKAETWDRYKDKAFTGRDDGMLRAEIDASQAKLKAYSYSQDSTVVIPRFRAVIGFVRSSIRQNGRMQAVTDDWTGKQPSLDSYNEMLFIRRALEKIGVKFKSLGELIDSGVLEAVLSPTNANIGAFLKKTEWQPEGMSGYTKLEDVLDYPELYEAYPQLRQVPVLWQKEPKYRGLTTITQTTGDVWVNMNKGLAPERMISTLLHEVQHVIQFIEGYAAGTVDFSELRGWMSDNGYLEQALTMDNRELYSRLAGEIESRNVQMRQDWTMDERLTKPFNETLEYPGEAITVRAKNLDMPEARFMGDGGVTFSVSPTLRADIRRAADIDLSSIKADAEKNGTFMKAPNGKPTKLTETQWLQVRTQAFKNWFGDWEKVARFRAARDAIMSMPVVSEITGKEFQSDGVPLTDKVPTYWQGTYHGVVESPELGRVILDKEGVKSSIGHGIGALKAAAFYAVPVVIQKGKVFDRQQNWKGRGYDTAVLAAPISIAGKEYICEVIVEQRPNRQGFYLHEVEVKEKLGNVFKTATQGGTRQASRSILV